VETTEVQSELPTKTVAPGPPKLEPAIETSTLPLRGQSTRFMAPWEVQLGLVMLVMVGAP